MVEFALEMGKRLSHALSEGLPDEAKHHLLNAQRELITALVIMYEHQAGGRRPGFTTRSSRSPATTRPRRAAPKKPRSTRIPVE
jgi:hypothetical protein